MFDSTQLYEKLTQLAPGSRRFCVALSGGLDSVVLLHALQSLSLFTVRAIHIHHGLSKNADHWEKQCRHICSNWDIPLVVEKIKLEMAGDSVEAAARSARYAAIKKELMSEEILLTAHTKNDQAETLLLQLLRGAGPKGMAAMPEKSKLGENQFLRPLLEITRAELESYANEHQLSWVEDESNDDLRFDRNFMRQQVLPLLQKRWPQSVTTLHRAALHCAEASTILEMVAEKDFLDCRGETSSTLKIAALLQLDTARQKNVIRYWLQQLQLPLPRKQQLQIIMQELILSRRDAKPLIKWQGVEIRRYDQYIYVMTLPNHDAELVLEWDFTQPLLLPNQLGTLTAQWQLGQGISLADTVKHLQIRFRKGGERLHPQGRLGSHPLKKLFQEWNIPPWLRDRVPLLYDQDDLLAVVNYTISAKRVASKNEMGLVIAWSPGIT
jgi:tRNA(Ile)-lysidine synthase